MKQGTVVLLGRKWNRVAPGGALSGSCGRAKGAEYLPTMFGGIFALFPWRWGHWIVQGPFYAEEGQSCGFGSSSWLCKSLVQDECRTFEGGVSWRGTASNRVLCLDDVKTRLLSLRGVTSSSFSWSYKRSYKEGFVWQDLESDDDLIFPTHNGSEYVVKGCKMESLGTGEPIPPSPRNMPQKWRENVHGLSPQVQPASRLAELPAPSTLTQLSNARNLLASDNSANPSNASSRRGDENIPFNLGVIEGLEHLHLAKAIDVNYDDTESQASTPVSHRRPVTAREQHNKNIQHDRSSKEPSNCKLHQKGPIKESKINDSAAEFSVIKKVKTTSSIATLNTVGADVTTQTGEDDEIIDIVEEYGKGKLPCLPEFFHTDNQACLERRDDSFSKQRVSSQSTLAELGQEEISPPPCSTSSASTTTSAHSAASSNVVSHSIDKLQARGLDKSSYLIAGQTLQEMELFLPSRVCSDKEALLNEYTEIATKPPLECNSGARETPNLSVRINKNLSSKNAVGDHSHANSKAALNSSKLKPHAMNLCSSSSRFLHLVSCGKGLEVFKPIEARSIKQNLNNISHVHGANSEEYPCLNLTKGNVNAGGESATNLATKLLLGKVLCNEEDRIVGLSPQDSNRGSKNPKHLRAWVPSKHKKKGKPKSKNIPTNFSVVEDAYTSLDLFEKHVAKLSTDKGTNKDCNSSQHRLITMESATADCSSSSHHR
ncbi:hypothetical protein L7F22_023632 [Adiantum nelumboides]|nr:hypothetical protein [Adiantum nelumboides]